MSKMLPLLAEQSPERRDAARNRERLLEAAAELIGTCDVSEVTMEEVAARAGVGKGTVFRRFGSREGLMAALLDHEEREWQASVISGPPPLGPGAPPMERLLAFGESRIRANLQQGALIEAAGRTWVTNYAVVGFTIMHVRMLLTALGVTGDLTYLATALVAPLALPVLRQQVELDGMAVGEILTGWTDLVHRVVG
ncbi:MAG TPA: helix-turn-helix domain-containing protein [Nocardioides sp.]|nr:helix-turn-helix domain-containing protein [Nocardioides sp.]